MITRYVNADEELLYDREKPRDQWGFLLKEKRGTRSKVSIFSFDESNVALSDGSLLSINEFEKSENFLLNKQGGLTVLTAGSYFVQLILQSSFTIEGAENAMIDLGKDEKELKLGTSAVLLSTARVKGKEEISSSTGFFQVNRGEKLALRISNIVDGYSFHILKGIVKIIKIN